MTSSPRGVEYSMGAPFLAGAGINYFLPDCCALNKDKFTEVRERLGERLLERARERIQLQDVSTTCNYPYLDSGMNCETIHIGSGGRWIEFSNGIHGICAFHNLDDYRDRILGFELAGDMMEFLDPRILAPRIQKERDSYALTYPLPRSLQSIVELRDISRQSWLRERMVERGLGQIRKMGVDADQQNIELEEGKIEIGEGMIRATNFCLRGSVRVSYILAKLVDISSVW